MTTKKYVACKETVDHQTGEVITSEIKFIKNVDTESFIMVFLTDMSGLLSIKGEMEQLMLTWMWKNSGWNNSPVIIDKFIKEEISKERGVKVQSISDALTRLVNKDVLVKNRRLFYSLNPKYFFKGDRKDRDEILKLSVEYRKTGKNVE
jgi:hypothetical protein